MKPSDLFILTTVAIAVLLILALSDSSSAQEPIVDDTVVFSESNGLIAVEAEHFFKQSSADLRAFYLTHSQRTPSITPDGDPAHVTGASGGAYLEILPDTRRTHGDKLIQNENFSPTAGKMAVLHYKVHFSTPGRYYVWVRAYSTGSEDNGLHVGLDGTWPDSGQRLQWCEGKKSWRWDSKQRTKKQHCGEPHKIFLDIKEAGEHEIQFSMREDGFEFDKWLMTTDREFKRPEDAGPATETIKGKLPEPFGYANQPKQVQGTPRKESPTKPVSSEPLQTPRQPNGDGSIEIDGEMKLWHDVTMNLNGPYAHEKDNQPNPFTDYRLNVTFIHADGTKYVVPGYFAADGNAGDSSAESGTIWRAHFAPDKTGKWSYQISFHHGKLAALDQDADSQPLAPFDGKSGSFEIADSDKQGRDLRAHGRLNYVGKHYLQFAGSGQYFLKAGADAPETLLAFEDFDNTIANNPKKAPLKSWSPHVKDWKNGDPTWGDGKGKGLIGAINYLSGKGCNAFSFLTYNAGGDGDNVWPFIHREDKLHYDCSKLDQWGTVFNHGTSRGMYLHFKMQETENDDNRGGKGKNGFVPTSLDGGDLGVQRKLYCRELIARFGHNLALNWNIGEENTQSTEQVKAMIDYIADLDAYDQNIVIHTFPDQQDKVYRPLLGEKSKLTGASLQNSSLETTHAQTVKWVAASAEAGKPWVVAFDESGSAAHAQCPDLGYRGFDGHDRTGKMAYTQHKVRQQTLWGTLMAGGAGCEYYFGYQFDENDILCEDWRSRDQSWDYCRIAINFFHDHEIPFWQMENADQLVGNANHGVSKFCFAKQNDTYLVYLPNGSESTLDLSGAKGEFSVRWFNPRSGGDLQMGSVESVTAGDSVSLGQPPADPKEDWLVEVRTTSHQPDHLSLWEEIESDGVPTPRHEAALVAVKKKIYLLGGRRINPVDVFDPDNKSWTEKSSTPIELHHFQAVAVDDAIYMVGAMTGPYPNEKPLDSVIVYYPQTDTFKFLHPIPTERRRGGAGAAYYNGKIYVVGGITNGHNDGTVPWLDEYDPHTGQWTALPDAPHARDHCPAVVVGDRLYAVGGRTTSKATGHVFDLTVAPVDVYDFKTRQWLPTAECPVLPTPRAGNMAVAWNDQVLVGGGEADQKVAHNEVEAYDVVKNQWQRWPKLQRGRHGSGFAIIGDYLYTASGSGNRGGRPELTSTERLRLPSADYQHR